MVERPEIPQHLTEGFSSTQKYEEDARRDYQISVKGWNLGVPLKSLENATVRRYISVVRDVEAAHFREASGIAERARERASGGAEEVISRPLAQQLQLYMLAQELLEEGFGRRGFDAASLRYRVVGLLKLSGGGSGVEPAERTGQYRPEAVVGGMWQRTGSEPFEYPEATIYFPEDERGDRERWLSTAGTVSERQDPEFVEAMAQEARRHGLAPNAWSERGVDENLARLVNGRALLREFEGLDALPEAPGMTPRAQDRLTTVVPLVDLAVRSVEEAFHPGAIAPNEVAGALAPIVEGLDMMIV